MEVAMRASNFLYSKLLKQLEKSKVWPWILEHFLPEGRPWTKSAHGVDLIEKYAIIIGLFSYSLSAAHVAVNIEETAKIHWQHQKQESTIILELARCE